MIVIVSGSYLKNSYLSNQKVDHSVLGFWFVVVLLVCFIYEFEKLRTSDLEQLLRFQIGGTETLRKWPKLTQARKRGLKPGLAGLPAPQPGPSTAGMSVIITNSVDEKHETLKEGVS